VRIGAVGQESEGMRRCRTLLTAAHGVVAAEPTGQYVPCAPLPQDGGGGEKGHRGTGRCRPRQITHRWAHKLRGCGGASVAVVPRVAHVCTTMVAEEGAGEGCCWATAPAHAAAAGHSLVHVDSDNPCDGSGQMGGSVGTACDACGASGLTVVEPYRPAGQGVPAAAVLPPKQYVPALHAPAGTEVRLIKLPRRPPLPSPHRYTSTAP
jgi:hypothetical protein